jgi:hypothetical protein
MNIVVNENGSVSLLDLHTGDMAKLIDALTVHAMGSLKNGARGAANEIVSMRAELKEARSRAATVRNKLANQEEGR